MVIRGTDPGFPRPSWIRMGSPRFRRMHPRRRHPFEDTKRTMMMTVWRATTPAPNACGGSPRFLSIPLYARNEGRRPSDNDGIHFGVGSTHTQTVGNPYVPRVWTTRHHRRRRQRRGRTTGTVLFDPSCKRVSSPSDDDSEFDGRRR